MKLEAVRIKWRIDDSPDTSWLGEYKNSPGPEDRTVDREYGTIASDLTGRKEDRRRMIGRQRAGRNEHRYFVAAMSGAETGNPDSVEQDFERMEALSEGKWHFMGCIAEAKLVSSAGVVHKITSGGLWGIESDSSREYIAEVETEQLSELRRELAEFGISAEEFDSMEVTRDE